MGEATHIVRFVAKEDRCIHLGQLVDPTRDVGLDSLENGPEIKAFLINGTIFDGEVTDHILTIEYLLSPVSIEDCSYVRCLGLNYQDHARVRHEVPGGDRWHANRHTLGSKNALTRGSYSIHQATHRFS